MRLVAKTPAGYWWRGNELITWVLILTGVGLNAAAQLLLKVATRPLAHFSDFKRRHAGQQRP
jgi:hypothetical protein